MENSPGTQTVSMFCRLLTHWNCFRLFLNYLIAGSPPVLDIPAALSCSSPDVSLFVFVRSSTSWFCTTTWISNKFSHILDHHSILYCFGWGRISASGSLFWQQMACLWIPLFFLFRELSNICQALVQHWFTESHDWSQQGLHVSSLMFALVRGFDLPVWLWEFLFEFYLWRKCKGRSWNTSKV